MDNNMEEVFRSPRNDWERKELELIERLHKFVYRDIRSGEAFCQLIFFYREAIAERKLLISDVGKGK